MSNRPALNKGERRGTTRRTLEVKLVGKVGIIEYLHGHLLAAVLAAEVLVFELDVVLNGLSRELDLLVDTGAEVGGDGPVADEGRDGGEDEELE